MSITVLMTGLIPAMTVGILVGSAVAGPDQPSTATAAHAIGPQALRLVCRIRPGHETAVRATALDLGIGGHHIRTDRLAAADDSFRTSLAHNGVTQLDCPLTWAAANPVLAEQSQLTRFVVVEAASEDDAVALLADLQKRVDLFDSVERESFGTVLGSSPPNDPHFALQYGLNNTGAPIGGMPGLPQADIRALEAWSLAGGSEVIIAVLDTGVSQSHPDLINKLVPGRNFVGSDPEATDDSQIISHGTACAGIAAASGNDGIGISGVSQAGRIMPVRVADQWGNSSDLACASGIIWAVDHGARVISISLGYSQGGTFLRAAVTYATATGAVIVAASGNTPGIPVLFPARLPEVIAVTATDNRDMLGPFCTTGPEVDVCAPGVMILTTTDSTSQPNSHRFETGTSMATPFVAGVAALLIETAPWLSSAEVARIIRDTADDRGPPGWDAGYGHGRVNAAMAIASLAGDDQVCVADWNGDGAVTSADLFAFLTDFFAGRADVNGDGQTDSIDLLDFVARYTAGC